MANRKNLRPKDVDEELDKVSGPREVNPMPRRLKKRNPGKERALKEIKEGEGKAEYPGMKE